MANYELDVRRMLCPMPVIKTQQKVKALKPGDTLRIVATDPGVMHDIPSWCRLSGHQVIDTKEQDTEFHLLIKIGDRE